MDNAVRQTLLARVYETAIRTPLQQAHKLSNELAMPVYLKREDLQPVHSFKLRGAYNKIAQLSKAEQAKGVIAASAGNHAQGVALSARKLGIPALIVMPRTTPSIKVEAVQAYGAQIELAGDNYSEAAEYCKQRIRETGRTYIHPFDDPLVIAGQGTIGREIVEQLPQVSHIFVPAGGGGLVAGIAQYVKAVRPEVRIVAVEPRDSNALQASLQAGRRVTLPHVGIFADGVAVKQVGKHTFAIAQRHVDDCITVDTDQLCAAIKSIFEETRGIVEPAGALGVAGIRAYADMHDMSGATAVAVCSGANIAFERLQFVAERTLLGSNKEVLLLVALPQGPGALSTFCKEVVRNHNITQLAYRLDGVRQPYMFVGIGIHDTADKTALMQKMRQHQYQWTDVSAEDIAKEHVRHMIGGRSPADSREHFYRILFPERPGVLSDFLDAMHDLANVSLLHYRGLGGDEGSVLIGFEAAGRPALEHALGKTGYTWTNMDKSESIHMFTTGVS